MFASIFQQLFLKADSEPDRDGEPIGSPSLSGSLSGSNLLNHFENATNVHTAESVVHDIIHIHH